MPQKSVLFLTLKTFSFTGGIEKVCRTIGYLLQNLHQKEVIKSTVFSLYDNQKSLNTNYVSEANFCGFNQKKISFTLKSVAKGIKSDVVILSHINLLMIGYLIKIIHPTTKVYLLAHGIEIWHPLARIKQKALGALDQIIAVSNFTAATIMDKHGLNPTKVTVLNNCLDPFFAFPKNFQKPAELLTRYQLDQQQPVLFSVCRLTSSEKYKGYEHTILVLPALIKKHPNLVYLLAGKYSTIEKHRLEKLIEQNQLSAHVKLLGFVSEKELSDHFLLGDIFVLPSKKEGFGIVFIEAMANGCNVIAGNKDGSVDATKNGAYGSLVNPDDLQELEDTISLLLTTPKNDTEKLQLQYDVIAYAGYEQYAENFKKLLTAT